MRTIKNMHERMEITFGISYSSICKILGQSVHSVSEAQHVCKLADRFIRARENSLIRTSLLPNEGPVWDINLDEWVKLFAKVTSGGVPLEYCQARRINPHKGWTKDNTIVRPISSYVSTGAASSLGTCTDSYQDKLFAKYQKWFLEDKRWVDEKYKKATGHFSFSDWCYLYRANLINLGEQLFTRIIEGPTIMLIDRNGPLTRENMTLRTTVSQGGYKLSPPGSAHDAYMREARVNPMWRLTFDDWCYLYQTNENVTISGVTTGNKRIERRWGTLPLDIDNAILATVGADIVTRHTITNGTHTDTDDQAFKFAMAKAGFNGKWALLSAYTSTANQRDNLQRQCAKLISDKEQLAAQLQTIVSSYQRESDHEGYSK